MDLKAFVDGFKGVACVMHVDLAAKDHDQKYIILEANDAYRKTVVEDPKDFVGNVPYFRYVKKAVNFEDLCDTCVQTGKPIHTYFDIEFYNAWMEVFLMPLESEDLGKPRLLFSYEMSPKADIDKLSDISSETANHVLKTCLKLRESEDFDTAMNSVIADVREHCDASRCCVLLTDFENRKASLVCEDYVDHEHEPSMVELLESPEFFNIIETWPRFIDGSNCFIIKDEEDMEFVSSLAPEWAGSMKVAGIKSLVIYPLRSEDKTIGYIWAGNFDVSKVLIIKETLSVTSFILSAEIANHQMVRQMQIMSSTDLLTGVLNRNAMNNRILDIDNGVGTLSKPFGVFFVDVNGLKTVNDTKGHLAGDDLLKDAAVSLRELAGDSNAEIYRVGGDEFLVIMQYLSIEGLNEVKERIIANAERPGRAHFAMGCCFSDEAEDIRRAMQLADARMYEDKERYYKAHPECEWDRRMSRRGT